MIESFVDLTYRGLALGRRVRLTQVRPSTGYLELQAPMPVGARIAVATDEGAAFEATVTGVHEQVAGSDRTPGMTVAPALADAAAAAWWTSRVALPDDDALRPRALTAPGRSRPVTVRPRSHTATPPPLPGATTLEVPTIIADLDARVATAAGVAPPAPAAGDDPHEARTLIMPLHEIEAIAARSGRADGEPEPAPPPSEPGDHEVVDDGNRTVLMDSIDPATLGIDLAGGEDDGGGDDAEVTDPGDTLSDNPTAQPPGGRPRRGARKRRR